MLSSVKALVMTSTLDTSPLGPPSRSSAVARSLFGLSVGVAGGLLFQWLDTPSPWLLGPIFAVACVNLAGLPAASPAGGRQGGQVILGTVIGLYFTPEIAGIVVAHLPWMILVAIVAIALGGFGAWVHMRFAGLDGPTAIFASVPGGMAEMITLGDRYHAEPVALTLSQTIRVTIVVVTIPAALTYWGIAGDEIFRPAIREVDWALVPVLLGAAAAVALALNRTGMTNAWMLGPCAFVAALTALEIRWTAMPPVFLIAAQVLIGVSLGERFEREALARAPRVIAGAALTTVVMMAVGASLAVVIARATGISLSAMVAATAPGGLAEMSITAQVLGLGVPLVTAYHIVRVFMITIFTLPLFRIARRISGHTPRN